VPFEEDRTSAQSSADVSVRVARAEESVLVASVLTEASVWLERRGMPLWEARDVDNVAVAGEVASGSYALAFEADSAVGTVRVTLEDPLFWPDAEVGEAVYVHRLAVRRSHAGGRVSGVLLAWASARATEIGRRLIRLDCDAKRPRLRAIYERLGFNHHSDRMIGAYFVARYQKVLAP
jgi:GNAT superfamily N-acetyltransferase